MTTPSIFINEHKENTSAIVGEPPGNRSIPSPDSCRNIVFGVLIDNFNNMLAGLLTTIRQANKTRSLMVSIQYMEEAQLMTTFLPCFGCMCHLWQNKVLV